MGTLKQAKDKIYSKSLGTIFSYQSLSTIISTSVYSYFFQQTISFYTYDFWNCTTNNLSSILDHPPYLI